MAHKALDIAKAIISLSNPEVGDIISNLKIQKLLYYAQGFSLVLLNRPLFDEDIVAWDYGPVVESVYHEFKDYGSDAIMPDKDFDASFLSDEETELMGEVYDVYGQFSALRLMNMTHAESPWKSTPKNGIISINSLKSYFKTQIED